MKFGDFFKKDEVAKLANEDVNLIIGTLVDSEYETREKLNRFGIKPQ